MRPCCTGSLTDCDTLKSTLNLPVLQYVLFTHLHAEGVLQSLNYRNYKNNQMHSILVQGGHRTTSKEHSDAEQNEARVLDEPLRGILIMVAVRCSVETD